MRETEIERGEREGETEAGERGREGTRTHVGMDEWANGSSGTYGAVLSVGTWLEDFSDQCAVPASFPRGENLYREAWTRRAFSTTGEWGRGVHACTHRVEVR